MTNLGEKLTDEEVLKHFFFNFFSKKDFWRMKKFFFARGRFLQHQNAHGANASLDTCLKTIIKVDEMIREADIDGDGQINYDEFVKMMMSS